MEIKSAIIQNIEDQLAYLVPSNSNTQFTFDEYPQFLRIPLGSYNSVNEVTGKMSLSLLRRDSSQPSFAHVTASEFTIALKDRMTFAHLALVLLRNTRCAFKLLMIL